MAGLALLAGLSACEPRTKNVVPGLPMVEREKAAVRFGAGFGGFDLPGQQVYKSLTGELVFIHFIKGDAFQAVEDLRRSTSAEWSRPVEIAQRTDGHPVRMLRLGPPDDPEPSYIGGLQCREKVGFTIILALPADNDVLAEERLAQVGCPGEPGVALPAFVDVAAAACAKGNASACAMF
jgi:hypothetical protein